MFEAPPGKPRKNQTMFARLYKLVIIISKQGKRIELITQLKQFVLFSNTLQVHAIPINPT